MCTLSTSKAPYHHGDLRAALIAAAETLLTRMGPSELSLRGVAREAGVSAMAPYRHFADKDALLAAVAGDGFRQFETRLNQATSAAPNARAGLIAQGVAYVRFAHDQPALFRLMFGPLITKAVALEHLDRDSAPALDALRGAVAAAYPQADTARRDDLVLTCWSLVHGLAGLIVDGRLPASAEVAEAMAARVLRLLP
ncbi:TetR/AcrR family transcriptional regulator [Caulobacter sp. DWR2-3-1b2]|uniref:TetR/AcrR family transcriptional regulator n=1 Tax=unclassified Caulobacter TaxID=2648921 RepID=UPI003CF90F8D